MNKPPKRPDRSRRDKYRNPSAADTGRVQRDRAEGRPRPNSNEDGLFRVSSLRPQKTNPKKTTPAPPSRAKRSNPAQKAPKPVSKFANPPQRKPVPPVLPPEPETLPTLPQRRWGWLLSWQLWGSFVVLISGTTGFAAMALLLKLPAVPNCPEMFLPTASASMRLYCAQVAANKQDAKNLLYAIQLVQNLPAKHPLRPEIDRMMASWVSEALRWGEDKYQTGDLEAAIALARQVALHFHDKALIEERVAQWQSTWSQGEKIEGEIEDHLERSAWGQAFQAAAKLTKLNNRYWAGTRYDQWYQRLNLARQESQKLDKAFARLNRGDLESLLAAIAIAEEVTEDSSAYTEARSLIGKASDRLIDLAFQKLKLGDWQEAMTVANSIPAKLGLNDEIIDINNLADAASTASYGSISNLEDAIALARDIAPGRPLYSRSQTLIRQWQSEIEGVSNLAQADRLAREGSESALKAAIAQARLIAANNPRYGEAQTQIARWQRRIETLNASSPLERGVRLTSTESEANTPLAFNPRVGVSSPSIGVSPPPASPANNLQPRVNPSSQNSRPNLPPQPRPNNPTTPQQDRSLLDEAVALANQGRYGEAIQTLGQINSESSLYGEAQNRRDRWQRNSQSQVTLARAYQQAANRTPSALRAAIDTARTIPPNSQVAVQSQRAISTWSAEILSLARGEAGQDLQQAIAIAQQVPVNTAAYDIARSQIAVWQEMLQNPPIPNVNKPPRESFQ